MNHGFQVVGIRQSDSLPALKPQNRRQKRPIASALILLLILSGCLACELIMTKDPSYLDLHH